MKKIFLLITLISSSVFANEIQGTMVLKGTAKSEVRFNRVKAACRVKIEDVKNMTEPFDTVDPVLEGTEINNYIEDSYGYPVYNVKVTISLNGSDFLKGINVSFSKSLQLNNLFMQDGISMVSDFNYHNADNSVLMNIDENGRLLNISFPVNYEKVVCHF